MSVGRYVCKNRAGYLYIYKPIYVWISVRKYICVDGIIPKMFFSLSLRTLILGKSPKCQLQTNTNADCCARQESPGNRESNTSKLLDTSNCDSSRETDKRSRMSNFVGHYVSGSEGMFLSAALYICLFVCMYAWIDGWMLSA